MRDHVRLEEMTGWAICCRCIGETIGLKVIEAQSLGTPVLGARIGGIPELIEEGVSGMTFASGDAADLKEKIRRMFSFSFDYETLAKNAVARYSSETYYEKLKEYYIDDTLQQ